MSDADNKKGPLIAGRFANVEVIEQVAEVEQPALVDNTELAIYIIENARLGIDSTPDKAKFVSEITKTIKKFCAGKDFSDKEKSDIKFSIIRFFKKCFGAEANSTNGGHKLILELEVRQLKTISGAEQKVAKFILDKLIS